MENTHEPHGLHETEGQDVQGDQDDQREWDTRSVLVTVIDTERRLATPGDLLEAVQACLGRFQPGPVALDALREGYTLRGSSASVPTGISARNFRYARFLATWLQEALDGDPQTPHGLLVVIVP